MPRPCGHKRILRLALARALFACLWALLLTTPLLAQSGGQYGDERFETEDERRQRLEREEKERQEHELWPYREYGKDELPDGQQDFNADGIVDGIQDIDGDGTNEGDADINRNGIPDGEDDRYKLRAEPWPDSGIAGAGGGEEKDEPGEEGAEGEEGLTPGGLDETFTQVDTGEELLAFKADKQTAFEEDQVLELEGNVVIFYRDMEFHADSARIDDKEKIFYGIADEGNEAYLLMPDRIIYGQNFWYDYSVDDFRVENARGEMAVQGLGESVHFKSREVRGNIDDFKLINTTLTTCRPEEDREWHIKAGMVKVLQDNKVIMRNATYYVMGIPLFFFPFYVYSLAETPVKIEVGRNRTEGTFVRVTYPYMYKPEDFLYGRLQVAWRKRLGWEFNTDHRYALHGRQWAGQMSTGFEFLDSGKGLKTESRFSTSQQFVLSETLTGNIAATQNNTPNIQAGTRSENFNTNVNLSNTVPSGSSSTLRFTFTSVKSSASSTSTNSASSSISLNHRQELFGLQFNGGADYDSQNDTGGLANNQNLNLNAGLQSEGSGDISWQVNYRQTIDPDGNRVIKANRTDIDEGGGSTTPDPADPGNDTFENDPDPADLLDPDRNSQTLQTLPEITISLRPGSLGNAKNRLGIESTRTELKLAHYIQRRADERINAVFAEFNSGWQRRWDLSETNQLRADLQYTQNWTGTGDASYSASPSVSWDTTFSDLVKQSLRWSYRDSEGASPITNAGSGGANSDIRYNLNYRTNALDWQLTTGRNFRQNTWDPLNFNLGWQPNPGVGDWRIQFSTAYDLEGGDLRPFNFQVSYTDVHSQRWQAQTTFVYDYVQKQISDFSTRGTWIVQRGDDEGDGALWVEFVTRYDTVGAETAILREVHLVKRNDCTFWDFAYNSASDAFILQAGITAYPRTTFAYGINSSDFINSPFQQFSDLFGNQTFGGQGPGNFTSF